MPGKTLRLAGSLDHTARLTTKTTSPSITLAKSENRSPSQLDSTKIGNVSRKREIIVNLFAGTPTPATLDLD